MSAKFNSLMTTMTEKEQEKRNVGEEMTSMV